MLKEKYYVNILLKINNVKRKYNGWLRNYHLVFILFHPSFLNELCYTWRQIYIDSKYRRMYIHMIGKNEEYLYPNLFNLIA